MEFFDKINKILQDGKNVSKIEHSHCSGEKTQNGLFRLTNPEVSRSTATLPAPSAASTKLG